MSEPTIDYAALLDDPEVAAKLPKDLRDYAERQKKHAQEREEENQRLRTQLREREVSDFLRDKGLPADLKGLVGDGDPNEWYNQYGKYFGTGAAGQGQGDPTGGEPSADAGTPAGEPVQQGAGNGAPPTSPGAALTPEQLQALAGITGQIPQGAPARSDADTQISEATAGAKSVDEFYELLKTVPGAVQGFE